MSSDNQNNNANNNPSNMPPEMNQRRRGSVTQQALAGLFRSNSTSVGNNGNNNNNHFQNEANRRRLSVSTTGIGLAGTSPTNVNAFNGFRRGSLSTNSDSFDENAIDEDETSTRTAPTTPFTRRMSFGGPSVRGVRNGGASPGSNDQGFNWSEQLRSRAESTVQGPRASFAFGSNMSTSPPRGAANPMAGLHHDRAKSVSDMPAPPDQAASMKPKPAPEPQRQKPDHFQERILKGDFYMD